MKLPIIDCKEVVPVRLIPFITQHSPGQQTLAQIFTHRWHVSGFPATPDDADWITGDDHKFYKGSFYAYRLNDEGIAVRMLSTEWDGIVRSMGTVKPLMRREEEEIGVRGAKESEWFYKTLRLLPEGSFMWRGDFEMLWLDHTNSYSSVSGERADTRKFNYDAHIRFEWRNVVWEGFEDLRRSIHSTEAILSTVTPVTTLQLEVPPEVDQAAVAAQAEQVAVIKQIELTQQEKPNVPPTQKSKYRVKKPKHHAGRKKFWEAVKYWVCLKAKFAKPNITFFRDTASRDPLRFDLKEVNEIPFHDESTGEKYYILTNNDEVPEGTVKNRISAFYKEATEDQKP